MYITSRFYKHLCINKFYPSDPLRTLFAEQKQIDTTHPITVQKHCFSQRVNLDQWYYITVSFAKQSY